MKTKNRLWVLVEIAIVLCSMLVVALPAIAADQNQITQEVTANMITAASEADYVLDVYGNANEDDTIDMRDLTYVKLIFFGKKPETELADAKYDGKINPLDFIQIKLIIVGKEKELTIVDDPGRAVTINKPVERIVILATPVVDSIRALKAQDKLVGVPKYTKKDTVFFPELSKLPSVGSCWGAGPDYEKIFELNPDIVIMYEKYLPEFEKKLEPAGITALRLELHRPKTMVENMKTLGYILDKRGEAEEVIDWYSGYIDTIKDRTERLSEDEKPKVYLNFEPEYAGYYKASGKGSSGDQQCSVAGGKNIAADIPGSTHPEIDPEWLIVQKPDIVIAIAYLHCGHGVDDTTGVKLIWEDLMKLEGLQNSPAVKKRNVYVITEDIRAGIMEAISITYWAKWFHPDLFEDLDPQAIHQEFIDNFCPGLDFDVSEHGVFVYHSDLYPNGR